MLESLGVIAELFLAIVELLVDFLMFDSWSGESEREERRSKRKSSRKRNK